MDIENSPKLYSEIQEKLKRAGFPSFYSDIVSLLYIQPKNPKFKDHYLCKLEVADYIQLILSDDQYMDETLSDEFGGTMDYPLVLTKPSEARELSEILEIVGPYLKENK